MGLLDRIQAARAAQTGAEVSGGKVLDLRDATAPAEEPVARPRQQWGRPGRCPDCNGQGYLDHIDMVDRIMFQHCKDCGHKWQVAQSEINAQA